MKKYNAKKSRNHIKNQLTIMVSSPPQLPHASVRRKTQIKAHRTSIDQDNRDLQQLQEKVLALQKKLDAQEERNNKMEKRIKALEDKAVHND